MKKTFEVWTEAWYGNGGREALAHYHGSAEAATFEDACRIVLGEDALVGEPITFPGEDRFRKRMGLLPLSASVYHRTLHVQCHSSLDLADPYHKQYGGYEKPRL